MSTEGQIYVDDEVIGTFTVDSEDKLTVEFNGGRWSAEWVFGWAHSLNKKLSFVATKI